MPIRRRTALRITLIAALVMAVGPVLLAVFLAREQGLSQEYARATALVQEIIYRSDRAVAQMQESLEIMAAGSFGSACSDAMLARMQQLGLAMEYVDALGYVENERILCSSMGRHAEPLLLDATAIPTVNDHELRLDVRFDIDPDPSRVFNVLSSDRYAVLASSEQAIDLGMVDQGLVLATFIPQSGQVRISRGELNPAWIPRLGEQRQQQFVDDGYIVVIMRSSQVQMTAALAAIPVASLNQQVREFMVLLLPVGLLAGVVLTMLVLSLARQRLSMTAEIRLALKRNEFFLVYQPIVDLASGHWVGAEALLRWRRQDGEITMPDTFIPMAEQSGLIGLITARVIELATQDMSALIRRYPQFRLSLNLSANDLQAQEIMAQLRRLSLVSAAQPRQIMVELTERILLNPEQANSNIQTLRQHGIQVAIDDFGTGYSSLSYLEKMQVDCLKIDRLFVEAIDTEAATNRVVLHIIDMARTLGITLVAEGVETAAQADFLRQHGVAWAQGWLYARPMAAQQLGQLFAVNAYDATVPRP
ncbi:MAG: EAL domain-containing protein [Pseudomonadales bacterium]|nr:EAL domain-containing protein [Pseudomonadales bacterium]